MTGEILSFSAFNRLYQNNVNDIFAFWTPAMQKEMATHWYGGGVGRYDFKKYLQASTIRFYYAYSSLAAAGCRRELCDIGGFWGGFPLTLQNLGYTVCMTEVLGYYSNAFTPLFDNLRKRGINIVDYDPFQPGAVLPRRFEAITVMAVLEHYPHSLQHFMRNILSMLDPQGKIYFDVPNIAFWPKRINLLLRGKTPITDFKEIYLSAVPFIGHHHEFTISEMRDLATLSGLTILKEIFYNYSYRLLRLRGWGQPLQLLANWLIKDSRECLALLCQPTAGGT